MSNLDSEFAGGCQHIQTVNIKTANRVQVLLNYKQPIGCKILPWITGKCPSYSRNFPLYIIYSENVHCPVILNEGHYTVYRLVEDCDL